MTSGWGCFGPDVAEGRRRGTAGIGGSSAVPDDSRRMPAASRGQRRRTGRIDAECRQLPAAKIAKPPLLYFNVYFFGQLCSALRLLDV